MSFKLLSEPVLGLLAEDALESAGRQLGYVIPEGFREDRWLWALRHNDVQSDRTHAPWVVRALVDDETEEIVGHAGFHGPPMEGTVTVAYSILAECRGHGYAKAALGLLVDEARDAEGVTAVQATISPDNAPSLAVISHWPFELRGEVVDEVDGLELVFELAV